MYYLFKKIRIRYVFKSADVGRNSENSSHTHSHTRVFISKPTQIYQHQSYLLFTTYLSLKINTYIHAYKSNYLFM